MPALEVSETTRAAVDGRDALVVTVVTHVPESCPGGLYLFPGTIAFTGGAADGNVRRFQFFEVGGETISVATFADDPADMPDWLPTADALIATLHFTSPTPSPSSGP